MLNVKASVVSGGSVMLKPPPKSNLRIWKESTTHRLMHCTSWQISNHPENGS